MASKNRPKGRYQDLLNIPSMKFKELTESEIRAIVNKLNDVANKRLKRIERSGYDSLSSSYRAREGRKFSLSRNIAGSDLRTAYLDVKSFLEGKTSTLGGTKEYTRKFDVPYEKILGKPLDDPSNYDKRFKSKKVLKKSVKKKIRDFWSKYDEWKEIKEKNNPDSAVGDTNINDVEEFEEELYDEGDVSVADMERKAREDYLKAEAEQQEEDLNNYDEDKPIQPPKPKQPGKARTKQPKHKGKGSKKAWQPKVSFETIRIFGDDD